MKKGFISHWFYQLQCKSASTPVSKLIAADAAFMVIEEVETIIIIVMFYDTISLVFLPH